MSLMTGLSDPCMRPTLCIPIKATITYKLVLAPGTCISIVGQLLGQPIPNCVAKVPGPLCKLDWNAHDKCCTDHSMIVMRLCGIAP